MGGVTRIADPRRRPGRLRGGAGGGAARRRGHASSTATASGGACVLTDCVPSKTLIATSAKRHRLPDCPGARASTAARRAGRRSRQAVNERIKVLAQQQSDDIRPRLLREGVTDPRGIGALRGATNPGACTGIEVLDEAGARRSRPSRPTSCCSPPAARRGCWPSAVPDGERILSWRDVYDLTELPEHLVVIGSGVTGAEFASGYSELGRAGHAGVQPRPGAARRGSGRGRR